MNFFCKKVVGSGRLNKQKYNEVDPKLVNSVVCAIDILGFSQMILDSCQYGYGNQLLKEMNYLINKNKQCIIPNKYSQGKIKIFTDNMVVAYPITHDGKEELDEILDNVAEYQFNLAIEGLFVRGGLSMGDFYINEDIVFGPALLDAHYAESKMACYPRIVLDAQTVEKLQNFIRDDQTDILQNKILIDNDGQWFLNYLNTIFKYYKECYTEYEFEKVKYALLMRHKEQIEKALTMNKENTRVWDKYVWIANYHNYFCDLHYPEEKELKICRKLLLSWPRHVLKEDF